MQQVHLLCTIKFVKLLKLQSIFITRLLHATPILDIFRPYVRGLKSRGHVRKYNNET